jgi:hypothetical protein
LAASRADVKKRQAAAMSGTALLQIRGARIAAAVREIVSEPGR